MYCYKCGSRLEDNMTTCANCGEKSGAFINGTEGQSGQREESVHITARAARKVNDLADQLNAATGGEGHVELRFKDFFVNVLKSHTEDEQNEIFACGSPRTTPAPQDIAREWPKPWYYTRLFIILALTTILLYFANTLLGLTAVLPGLMFVGAMVGPIPVLMFFFEVNLPRNISISKVIEMFFLGGCLSLLISGVLYSVYNPETFGFIDAMLVGIIEEAGKAGAIIFFISREKNKRFIFNGLLIGGAVGAGFAVFETAGYILGASMEFYSDWFSYGVNFNMDNLVGVLIVRGVLAIGGHVAWGAVTGGAIMIALNHREFRWSLLHSPAFLRFFIINIVLHGLWDMTPIILPPLAKIGILCAAIWVVIAVILNRGLAEINALVKDEGETS